MRSIMCSIAFSEIGRFAHGLLDRVLELRAVEVLAALVALHDLRQELFDALARGEAPAALVALAPPADLLALARRGANRPRDY